MSGQRSPLVYFCQAKIEFGSNERRTNKFYKENKVIEHMTGLYIAESDKFIQLISHMSHSKPNFVIPSLTKMFTSMKLYSYWHCDSASVLRLRPTTVCRICFCTRTRSTFLAFWSRSKLADRIRLRALCQAMPGFLSRHRLLHLRKRKNLLPKFGRTATEIASYEYGKLVNLVLLFFFLTNAPPMCVLFIVTTTYTAYFWLIRDSQV